MPRLGLTARPFTALTGVEFATAMIEDPFQLWSGAGLCSCTFRPRLFALVTTRQGIAFSD